jgi:hypothetical protein
LLLGWEGWLKAAASIDTLVELTSLCQWDSIHLGVHRRFSAVQQNIAQVCVLPFVFAACLAAGSPV